jgi:hypothetical protein
MLMAIQNTTLFDDGYGEDPTTSSLEAHMAELCGHEAGVFLLSGKILQWETKSLSDHFSLNLPMPFCAIIGHISCVLKLEGSLC